MSEKLLKTIERDDFGITALDGIPVVSSRHITEVFEKDHKHVLESIRNSITTLQKADNLTADFSSVNFIDSNYKIRGKLYPEFLLTKDGFTYIVMGFQGDKAAKFKVEYINRFNAMEKFIQDRLLAKLEYPELTVMIKQAHEKPMFYHYSNEADMINKIVLGCRAKEFRLKHQIPDKDGIRDYMFNWQIEAIQKLQKADVALVIALSDIEDRKRILQSYFDTLIKNLEFPKLLK
jgi:Rha family phage regulatory protein